MNIKNAQQQVDEWIKNHGVRYFNELTNMAQLTEEVGEVATKILSYYRPHVFGICKQTSTNSWLILLLGLLSMS